MDFKGIFQVLIDNYGLYGLIIAFCLVGICVAIPVLINKQSKKMSADFNKLGINLSNALQNQNDGLINKLSETQDKLLESNLNIINNLLDQKNHKHQGGLNIRDKVSIPIQNHINHLKDLYRASRVGVFEFHNSLVNLNGLPFLWYDLIYESIIKGVHSMSVETRNMPYNILSPITSVIQNGETKLFNRKDIENFYNQSSVLYDFTINKMNINSLICSPILNQDNQLVGMVTLEYSYDNYLDIDDLDLTDIGTETKIISALLELNKKQDINEGSN